MRISLKIFLSLLLFTLLAVVGTEVVALYRRGRLPGTVPGAPPVVVRKSVSAATPPKSVRRVPPPALPSERAPFSN